jgi:Bacterial cell division membrane protein
MFKKLNIRHYNFILLILSLLCMCTGTVIIQSVKESLFTKQAIGVAASFVIIIVLSLIDYHFVCNFYRVIYLVAIGLLLAVLVVGENIGGATRWVEMGGFQFQPSELVKIIMIVCLARLLSDMKENEEINTFRGLLKIAVFCGVPLLLIVIEPDLSTTICLTLILVTMIYASGLSYKLIVTVLLILIPLGSIFIWYIQKPDQKLLDSYQRDRIMSFIYPSEYSEGAEQQENSVLAIGSGELKGKGLYPDEKVASVKNAKLVSEQQTDFIFSVIGEAFGFIGSVITIGIILIIVLQCIRVARLAKDDCGQLIALGVGCLIGYQSFINIGVTTKLLPNTGLPLPFFSYGLSSLLSVSMGIGLVLNVSMQRRRY